mmetsp:Transcript_1458/g.2566  ORF Transcript_1458/g.2566 Transcript_1458/m.2566 type:complete len:449 (-) Transcript_1458:267-1613(-)|eukprot:CAMPEP_0196134642 /NCGR_PEP_ID=MMETSP0910-20130528/3494_1 /TAXON_ID=49265 /ORGANISM="Thalassiosira rotula, Strain GSO102" /LENGTH=448 /DNA_ID=CAMNT_0041394615 /DNA_START=149 /DNA_END=1495 /DNA_ORIENTATION=-
MSRYPPHQQYSKPPIVVTDNDVLSGRGVNIAAHPGNERFRTLVTTRADASYCETYSATEKKAVAEEIVRHIASLEPSGRFLKREGRGQVSRGLNGPWEELSRRESIKKTCQALRDCNRSDRATYAHGVAAPTDVKAVAEELATSGLALKDRAARAAEECAVETSTRLREAMESAGVPEETIEEQLRRQRADPTYVIPGFAMTANGNFAPIAQPGYPAVMQVIGPDGIPIPTHDPVPTPGQMPGIYSMYPHPAVDAAPINMEAHLAARAAAGYVHPDDRAAMAQNQLEQHQQLQMEAERDHEEQMQQHLEQGEEMMEHPVQEGMKEEDAAVAAEEAAAAVANLDSAVAAHEGAEVQEGVEAAEIAVAMAQDATDVFGEKTEEEPAPPQAAGEEMAGGEENGGTEGTEAMVEPKTEEGGEEMETPAAEEGGESEPPKTVKDEDVKPEVEV